MENNVVFMYVYKNQSVRSAEVLSILRRK